MLSGGTLPAFVVVSFGPGNRHTEGKIVLEASQKSTANRGAPGIYSLGHSWCWGMILKMLYLYPQGSGSWEGDRQVG